VTDNRAYGILECRVMETILSLLNISKTFGGSKPLGGGKTTGGIRALDEAEFSLARGESMRLSGRMAQGRAR